MPKVMSSQDGVFFHGDLTFYGSCRYPENAFLAIDEKGTFESFEGKAALKESPPWMRSEVKKWGNLFVLHEPNGFVNTGLNIFLDRAYGIAITSSSQAVNFIAVSAGTSAVTNATVRIDPTSQGNVFKPISPIASRSSQTVTAGATYTTADFTTGVFIINKVGLLTTSSDAGTGLIDVIGGTGGADPYSRTFVVDFTNAGSFTLTPQIAVTAIRVASAFPTPL